MDYRACFAAGTLMLAALLCGPAFGQANSARERAGELLRQGNALHDSGKYPEALQKFREAHDLFPSPKIIFNFALSLNALGRQAEAAVNLEQFLITGGKDSPAAIVKKARDLLEELRARLGSLSIRCPVPGVAIKVDGRVTGHTPLDRRIYLPPGLYELSLEKTGYRPVSRDIIVKGGQHRPLELQLEPVAVAAPSPVAASTAGPAATAPRAAQPAVQRAAPRRASPRQRRLATPEKKPAKAVKEGRSTTRKLLTGLSVGTAAALGITSVVLFGVGAAKGETAHDLYNASRTPQEFDQHRQEVKDARDMVTAGAVLLGLAAVAGGAAIYLLMTRPDEPHNEGPGAHAGGTHLRPGIAPVAGGAGLTLGGVF